MLGAVGVAQVLIDCGARVNDQNNVGHRHQPSIEKFA